MDALKRYLERYAGHEWGLGKGISIVWCSEDAVRERVKESPRLNLRHIVTIHLNDDGLAVCGGELLHQLSV